VLDTVFVIGFKVVKAAVDLINAGLDVSLSFEDNVGLCDIVDIKLGLGLFVGSKERTGTLGVLGSLFDVNSKVGLDVNMFSVDTLEDIIMDDFKVWTKGLTDFSNELVVGRFVNSVPSFTEVTDCVVSFAKLDIKLVDCFDDKDEVGF